VQTADVAPSNAPNNEDGGKEKHSRDHVGKKIKDQGVDLADGVIPNGMHRGQGDSR